MKPEHQLNRIDHQILAILADDPGRTAGEIGWHLFSYDKHVYHASIKDTQLAAKILGYLKDAGYVRSEFDMSRPPNKRIREWQLTGRGHAAVALSHVAELHAAY